MRKEDECTCYCNDFIVSMVRLDNFKKDQIISYGQEARII